jgi:uncharacterized membrane protein YfcA
VSWWDPAIAVAGVVVGVVVGLTGMGGGALMTPVLVFIFGVQPLAAVSSDIVASLFMKPVGGLVHLRNGTVHLGLVRWLCVGSVPGALGGVFLLRLIGDGEQLQHTLLILLGGILILASLALTLKAYLNLRARAHRRATGDDRDVPLASVSVRRPVTALVGAVGGLMVGLTSVGAGSVLIVCLLLIYPTIRPSQLVGTDLVQAVPLVAAASLGHLLFGDFTIGLTGSILVGAIPGVWFGARLSSHSRGMLVRRALAIVMLASGAKLLGASTGWVAVLAGAAAVLGPIGWALVRVRHGEPAFVLPRWYERSLQRRRTVTRQFRGA